MPPQSEPPPPSADAPSAPTHPTPRRRRARRWLVGADLALRRAELERRLRRAKAAAMRSPPSEEAVDALEIAPDERPRLVAALVAATFPQTAPAPKLASGTTAPPPTAAEQEARLVEAMTLEPEAVASLLAARHAAARDALVAAGLEPGRLFTVQGGERAAKESGPRVYFTVR